MKARVLFVGAFPPEGSGIYGGNVTACRRLLRSSFGERLDLDLLDSTQISNPPPALTVRLILAARRLMRYVRRFEARRPDAVLLLVALGGSVVEKGVMAWYARLRGVPAAVFPRGGALIDQCERSRLRRRIARLAFGGADLLFCQGPRWQRFAAEVLGLPASRAPLVPNWTATEELVSTGRQRRYGQASTPRLVFVGWLDREKGVEDLLLACRHLAQRHDFRLSLVGEGNVSVRARGLVQAWGLSDRVDFVGSVQEEQLREQLAQADVFVLPSWAEGLPNAMVEGMATGLPVVATRVGSIPDYVEDGVHGLLVPPRDAAALATAIERLLQSAELRERLGRASHDVAAKRFVVEQAAETMVRELSRIGGLHDARPAGLVA